MDHPEANIKTPSHDEILKTFNEFDEDKNGKVCKGEMGNYLKR